MKLENKKTGEIVEVKSLDVDSPIEGIKGIPSFDRKGSYNSLAELNAEWEDYEEPKEYWFMDYGGRIKAINDANDEEDMARKAIGNYFETKEEAEKAVEKLKAWKRLKDKGFKFNGWEDSPAEDDFDMLWFTMKAKVWDVETQEALDLLFGGEE